MSTMSTSADTLPFTEHTTMFNGTASASDENTVDSYLLVYLTPAIFLLGCIGNILTLLVMRRPRLRGSTVSVYLPWLAVADTAVLWTGFPSQWLEECGFLVFKELHEWTCKWEKFLFYTSGDTAIWILVLFTVDRFIAVCFPLRKQLICVPKRAKIACFAALLTAVVKNVHVFWTRGMTYDASGSPIKNCGYVHEYFEVYVRPWIAFALVSALPFAVILICNVLIIQALMRIRRERKVAGIGHADHTFTQTTAMCLSASFAFLLFIAPSIVLLIGKPYWTTDANPNNTYDFYKNFNNLLVFVNHSINFLLYCLTGKQFRQELRSMLRCDKADGCGAGSLSHCFGKHNKASYSLGSGDHV